MATNRPQIDHDCDINGPTQPNNPGNTSVGKTGPPGPPGKDGKDGKDGQVTEEHISSIVSAIMVQIQDDDRFRGPKGDPGPPGSSSNVDIDAIVKQVRDQLRFDVVHPNLYGSEPERVTVDFAQGKPTLYLPDSAVKIKELDDRVRQLESEVKNGR